MAKKNPHKDLTPRCLQCKKALRTVPVETFCSGRCHQKWAKAKIKEDNESPGVYIKINDKTSILVKNPTRNKIKEVKEKWGKLLNGRMTTGKIYS